jgi:hypothetical protein
MNRAAYALVALAGIVAAAPAFAQNALGDGRSMQRDTSKYGTSTKSDNNRRSFADEARFRNSIITGNAPGGLSFRGAVGYRDSSEITSRLGSDTLYKFRRDSLYSGLAGQGIRGTEALQYQFSMTTGGGGGSDNLVGRLSVNRMRASATAAAPIRRDRRLDEEADSAFESGARSSTDSTRFGTLRSTAVYSATRGLTPQVVGVRDKGKDGLDRTTASSLLGVQTATLYRGERSAGGPGSAAPGSAVRSSDTSARALLTGERSGSSRAAADAAKDTRSRTSYDRVLDRLDEWKPSEPEVGRTPGGSTPPEAPGSSRGVPAEGASEAPKPWESRLDVLRSQLSKEAEAARAGAIGTDGKIDEDTIRMIRAAGGKTPEYITAEAKGLDAFAAQMKAGQDLMKAGRYFDAEERFSRALFLRKGEVSAMAGRVHAQIGAGMDISASVNLREMLVSHPEVIGLEYGEELLPARARSKDVLERYTTRLETDLKIEGDAGKRVVRETSLMLAYVGFQAGDPAALEKGLASLESASAGEGGDEATATLAKLLRRVWTGPDEPAPATPAVAPEK